MHHAWIVQGIGALAIRLAISFVLPKEMAERKAWSPVEQCLRICSSLSGKHKLLVQHMLDSSHSALSMLRSLDA